MKCCFSRRLTFLSTPSHLAPSTPPPFSTLAKSIQEALDASKRASDMTATKVRKVREEGSAELTKARAAWKAGEAARRAKFMERKAKEARSLTLQGLQVTLTLTLQL